MTKPTHTPSLREFGRAWAPVFGLSSEEMYGRQRALTESGLIEGERKSGPGRGVRQTAWNTALLLTALLCAPSRIDTEKTIRKFAYLEIEDDSECQFTGQKTFVMALKHILQDEVLLAKIYQLHIFRSDYRGSIQFWDRTGSFESVFTQRERFQYRALPTIRASIPGDILREIGPIE
jgi:hypothetical protein